MSILLVAGVSTLALSIPTTAASAATAAAEVDDPVVSGLAGPLQFDLGDHGQTYIGQAFSGALTKLRPNGTTTDLLTEPGEVGGVASRGYNVAYTFTGGDETNPVALLKLRQANGKVRTIANLRRFEERNNPDGSQRYGFRNLAPECAAQVPPEIGGEPYTGLLDAHPYAVANAPDGGWFVADAGANAVYHVGKKGKIEVVWVPRPQKTSITAEAAAAVGLPECTVGATYAFEPVPTDVEVNAVGMLIVSLLPGGPEDASLGARGAVYRVDPFDGEWTRLADGFLGATNVAVAPGGRIYVTELFANRISRIYHRQVTTVVDVPSPGAVEFRDGRLFASIDVFANGSIVRVRP
ncbi:ScyD/ScyE family protein [Nocardioides sp.]|uniref:ScyD/ScyE family protein n=1 Tax=Nocardioides sp. TaxID=35761 RepID=UPI003D1081BC